jgi:ribosomal-protein-alanine N-acetyltransferase
VAVQHTIEPGSIHIAPLTRQHAEDISTWRYDPPYDLYDMVGVEPEDLLDPDVGYHAVLAGDRLIGFRSFGPDGQVPGWDYDDSALDTGGGLRPELTGQGLGRSVISAGLEFGRARFAPAAFRVTVASFNARALRTVRALGFERVGSFKAVRDLREFDVLVRPESTDLNPRESSCATVR